MDIFAHSLWTNAAFYKKYKNDKRDRFLAVLFGILPDLISFVPSFIYLIFSRQNFYAIAGELNRAPLVFRWAVESYNYTHSIVIFLLIFLIVTAIRKGKIFWPMLGWPLHIFIDLFTHKDFFETPILFPLSNAHFTHGISWANPTFMIINYSAIAIVYLFWFLVLRKKEK